MSSDPFHPYFQVSSQVIFLKTLHFQFLSTNFWLVRDLLHAMNVKEFSTMFFFFISFVFHKGCWVYAIMQVWTASSALKAACLFIQLLPHQWLVALVINRLASGMVSTLSCSHLCGPKDMQNCLIVCQKTLGYARKAYVLSAFNLPWLLLVGIKKCFCK